MNSIYRFIAVRRRLDDQRRFSAVCGTARGLRVLRLFLDAAYVDSHEILLQERIHDQYRHGRNHGHGSAQ